MRRIIVAALLGAAFGPASAQRPIVHDGIRPVPNVTLHVPRSAASEAGTSWREPAQDLRRAGTRFDTREYRGGAVRSNEERAPLGVGDSQIRNALRDAADEPYFDEDYDRDRGFISEERDQAYPERLDRGGDRDLSYDRDYPYDYPYGGEGVNAGSGAQGVGPQAAGPYGPATTGGYTVVETIVTTTTPDTVRPARPGEIVRRRATRRR